MQCAKCRNEAVFFQASAGRHLCARHLILDIESRAKRAIRAGRGIRSGDHIGVLLTGDRAGAALLHFFHFLTKDRRDIRLSVLMPDTGGPGCGEDPATPGIADLPGIPVALSRPGGTGVDSRDGITRIALPITLDDAAAEVAGLFLSGDADRLLHPGSGEWNGIPVICPFIAIPSDEIDRYAEYAGNVTGLPPHLPAPQHLPEGVAILLEAYYRHHPGTRYALLHLAEQLSGGRPAAPLIPWFTGGDADDTGVPSRLDGRPNS